ncbi:hypothetical protein [Gimesia sp.]|uniref:hypothetical protein n=1 Tax=Gimesia sp. TaxID=2024833 RepID=UPI003A8E8D16
MLSLNTNRGHRGYDSPIGQAFAQDCDNAKGLTLPDLPRVRSSAVESEKATRNKCVVSIWLGGGPTHIESWDQKQNTPKDYHPVQNRTEVSESSDCIETGDVGVSGEGSGEEGDNGGGGDKSSEGGDDDDGEPPISLLLLFLAFTILLNVTPSLFPQWEQHFTSLLQNLAGALGGLSRFLFFYSRRYYKNNFVRRAISDIVGGAFVGTFLNDLFPTKVVPESVIGFCIGFYWRDAMSKIRIDTIRKCWISIPKTLRKVADAIDGGIL